MKPRLLVVVVAAITMCGADSASAFLSANTPRFFERARSSAPRKGQTR